MKLGSWFGGCIGWMLGGPLGALLGFVLGSMVEGSDSPSSGKNNQAWGKPRNGGNSDRDNFLFSLLVLSSCVIKADGKIMHSEMEYVRRFFRQNFGEDSVADAEHILLQLFKQDIDVMACGQQISEHLDYGQRLQLLSYLVGIAKADGNVPESEIQVLRKIAQALQLSASEVNSMLNLGSQSLGDAYKVLEVAESCTDEELRKAYKLLVLKNHPDRVAALGEDIRRGAEEKLKNINDAYARICKARGLK